ncbi:DUF1848 domain-containing protein [Desulfosporosinus sp. SRJS8]|nr:DUF1848 domain-containing protein [Desulfosporosinus sp. SRJS8]
MSCDNQYIRRVFGQDVPGVKDKSQRSECGCIKSKDIGVYDTCLHGCAYCLNTQKQGVSLFGGTPCFTI